MAMYENLTRFYQEEEEAEEEFGMHMLWTANGAICTNAIVIIIFILLGNTGWKMSNYLLFLQGLVDLLIGIYAHCHALTIFVMPVEHHPYFYIFKVILGHYVIMLISGALLFASSERYNLFKQSENQLTASNVIYRTPNTFEFLCDTEVIISNKIICRTANTYTSLYNATDVMISYNTIYRTLVLWFISTIPSVIYICLLTTPELLILYGIICSSVVLFGILSAIILHVKTWNIIQLTRNIKKRLIEKEVEKCMIEREVKGKEEDNDLNIEFLIAREERDCQHSKLFIAIAVMYFITYLPLYIFLLLEMNNFIYPPWYQSTTILNVLTNAFVCVAIFSSLVTLTIKDDYKCFIVKSFKHIWRTFSQQFIRMLM